MIEAFFFSRSITKYQILPRNGTNLIKTRLSNLINKVSFGLFLIPHIRSYFTEDTFLKSFMIRDAINFKLSYFCRSYQIKFRYILVVSVLCYITLHSVNSVVRPRCYLLHLKSTINKYLSYS